MVKIIIPSNPTKIANLSQHIPEIRKKGLNYTSQCMIANLKKNSPVDHGLLRSWFFSNISDSQVTIKTPAIYAPYVNDGTGIYGPYKTPIYSKSIGKPLAFEIGGQMIYVKMIRGQKGQHFVERSIEQTQKKISQ